MSRVLGLLAGVVTLLCRGCTTGRQAPVSSADLVIEAAVDAVTGPSPSPYCEPATSDRPDCGVWELTLSDLRLLHGQLSPGRRFVVHYVVDDNGHVLTRIHPVLISTGPQRRQLAFERWDAMNAYVLIEIDRSGG